MSRKKLENKKQCLQVYLNKKDFETLEELACLENLTLSEFVREIIKEYLKNRR